MNEITFDNLKIKQLWEVSYFLFFIFILNYFFGLYYLDINQIRGGGGGTI